MLLLNRILEATSLLDTRQSRTWTQYFWIVILRYCNDTGCLESEEFFQKLRVRGKWSHFLQTLIGKFYRSINAPSEKERKIYQEFLARKMSTFLSFPSIHHIYRLYLGENTIRSRRILQSSRSISFRKSHLLARRESKISFALWFQFTILNIIDYYIPRRSSIDSSRKNGGRERWKYVIGISNHWNYWNLTGKLGKTELEKVIIPAGCILSLAFFLPFFPSSFLSFLFFFFSERIQEGGGEEKEVVLHRLAISNPRREHILAADRLPSWKHCYGFNISWERSPLVGSRASSVGGGGRRK